MKKIKQSEFVKVLDQDCWEVAYEWVCPNCGRVSESYTTWHDDFVVCIPCQTTYQIEED